MEEMIAILWQRIDETIPYVWEWLNQTIPYIDPNQAILPGLWTALAWPVIATGMGLLYYLFRR